MIISDSNHSNLQLVGSKFTQKHHLYDLYKNSILDTQKSDASIKDSIF